MVIQLVLPNGNHFYDKITGNDVYVKGDKVYVENQNGEEVTRFHNSKSNTQWRIETGRWEPVYE